MNNGSGRIKRLIAGGALGLSALAFAPSTASADVASFCANVPTGQSGFTDIAQATTHARNVECAKGAELTSGKTATTYDPTGDVSRAQMATFIANMVDKAGELDSGADARTIPDLPASPPDAFTDDENTGGHENNINRLAAADIIQGTGGTTYNPTGPVSRAQMATFIAEALEFIRGAALPEGADRFTDDETSVHEANINRLANAGIIVGTGGTTYNPSGPVSRAQMASFLVQAMADLFDDGFITAIPGAQKCGVLTAENDAGDTYTFTDQASQTSIVVVYDATNDVFVVDGTTASQAAFEAATTVGDDICFTDDPATAATDADRHALTNVNPASRRTGTVGNVNIGAPDTFAIVDPVTGVVIGGPHSYTGDVLQVGGTAVPLATFEGAINEGDTISGTVDAANNETWNLTNQTTTGTVANRTEVGIVGDGQVAFNIGGLGDDHKDDVENLYVTGDDVAPATETFTIGGASATAAQFEAALNNGDTVAYSRNGNAETFALTNVPPPTVSGVLNDGAGQAIDTAGDVLQLTVGGAATDTAVDYTGSASFRVDNVTVTETEFEAALNSGDNVTFTPNNPDTPANEQAIAVTNANLTGGLADIQTAAATDRYDVINAQANAIHNDLDYTTVNDRYFRNNTEISLADFETLLNKIAADTTPDDSITVVRSAIAIEHRLTTDETLP